MAIDFKIRDFLYPIGIYRLRRIFEQTQWLPENELRSYQEQLLRVVINQAFNHVPYYHQLFAKMGLRPADIRSVDDLGKLPTLSKETVRNGGANFIADNAARYRPTVYRTSGTTGAPMEIYLDKHAMMLEFVYYWRHWSWAGYKLGDCFAELGSFYFLQRERLTENVSSWQPHLRRLMLNSGKISTVHARDMATAIRKQRPKYLKGMASTIYFLALCFKEAEIHDISFKAIFSTGEVLTPQYRAMAGTVFKCPVLDSYGHMEGTVAISQCMDGGYHINSDYGILEFSDGRSSSDGKEMLASAIGTSLYNRAMPLIRYDVGDDIELFAKSRSCPCGRTLPLVRAVHGRSEDTVVTSDGRFITSLFIVPEFIEGIRIIQFIQESRTLLHINIVPNESWDDKQREKMFYYVKNLVGADMNIIIRQVMPDEITRDASGKMRSVISYVKI